MNILLEISKVSDSFINHLNYQVIVIIYNWHLVANPKHCKIRVLHI